jgi:hypothetical protein
MAHVTRHMAEGGGAPRMRFAVILSMWSCRLHTRASAHTLKQVIGWLSCR